MLSCNAFKVGNTSRIGFLHLFNRSTRSLESYQNLYVRAKNDADELNKLLRKGMRIYTLRKLKIDNPSKIEFLMEY